MSLATRGELAGSPAKHTPADLSFPFLTPHLPGLCAEAQERVRGCVWIYGEPEIPLRFWFVVLSRLRMVADLPAPMIPQKCNVQGGRELEPKSD